MCLPLSLFSELVFHALQLPSLPTDTLLCIKGSQAKGESLIQFK